MDNVYKFAALCKFATFIMRYKVWKSPTPMQCRYTKRECPLCISLFMNYGWTKLMILMKSYWQKYAWWTYFSGVPECKLLKVFGSMTVQLQPVLNVSFLTDISSVLNKTSGESVDGDDDDDNLSFFL